MRSKCLYCQTSLSDEDDSVGYCTVCECRMHGSCSGCPNVLSTYTPHPYYGAKLVHDLPLNRMVCKFCLRKWQIKEVVTHKSMFNTHYYYALINHPSAIHYTWLKHSDVQEYLNTHPHWDQ